MRVVRYAFGFALSVLAVVGCCGSAFAIRPGPEGDAFYVPPTPLAPGTNGSVIWVRALSGTMALPGAARNLLVLYRSEDPQGQPVAVSGTIALPEGTAPAGGWPVITWTHGTTGLAAICGPSRDTADGPEHAYIADIRTLLDRFVAAGYVVVATDYQGLGVAGFHPFLQGVPNGKNALDMVRAARELEPEIGTRYAVMGHSQGGQADLFTAAEGLDYAPELQLMGNVAMAPGTHIADRVAAVRASDKTELALPYVLYTLQSYATIDPTIDIGRILTAKAQPYLAELHQGCMTKALTDTYWATAIAKDQFLPDPDLSAFLKMAAQNEPGTLKLAVPTLVMQGTADVTVRPKDTDASVRALCAKGNMVTYKTFTGQDHDGVMAAGAGDALAFMADRFAGKPAPGNCDSLPSAAP
ncbi:lipase family protein [Xanthobacter sp. DSM 24535]|uniref:lipase family protein n=1 Tax=Roseixanthobacter psychrophilus TaxID=3119917 RepID=UPI00372BD65F